MESLEGKISFELAAHLLQNLSIGIVISDHNENIVWCNNTLAKFLNTSPDSIVTTTLSNIKSSKLRPISDHSDTVLVPGNEEMPDRWLKHHSFTLGTSDNASFTATIYSDITEISSLLAEQEKLTEQLNQLSTVDRESGLLNHRAMLQHLEPLVSRSRRYHNELSVIAMEITSLDNVIDKYGPDAGTQTIVEVARLLKDQLRWADIVSRVEYNRFTFILPETDQPSAMQLANKISSQIVDLQIHFDDQTLKVETAFGVTAWEKGNDSVLLLRKASKALESAKNKGRNSIESV